MPARYTQQAKNDKEGDFCIHNFLLMIWQVKKRKMNCLGHTMYAAKRIGHHKAIQEEYNHV